MSALNNNNNKINKPEKPANFLELEPLDKIIKVANYDIGVRGDNIPFIQFVTTDRFEASGGQIFFQVTLQKEFYTSLEDGIYKGTTTIILKSARLEKHSHITTKNATVFRYIMIFENLNLDTKTEMIETRQGNKISDKERQLMTKQMNMDKIR